MILNYLFTGAVFTLIIDCIISWKIEDPRIISILNNWNNNTRIICILIWPIGILIFFISFLKSFFK